MSSFFPFDQPRPTALYLALYLITFAVHHLFMHYVLAGTIYLAGRSLVSGNRTEGSIAATIRDWLPFLLSAAITAGVAPLLFVQILYARNFYTANLLLSWKWMIVVPVLIAAFYLLYLIKSAMASRWPAFVQAAVALIAALCFVFVGFCWTVNHQVGNAESTWSQVYASGDLGLKASSIITRMATWVFGSFASLAVLVGWQRYQAGNATVKETATLATMGMMGIFASLGAGLIYLLALEDDAFSAGRPTGGLLYLSIAFLGAMLQLTGWFLVLRSEALRVWPLATASIGLGLTLLAGSTLRELLRIQFVDIATYYRDHAEASQIGGLNLFLFFATLNGLFIALCIWLVQPRISDSTNQASSDTNECPDVPEAR